MTIALPAPLITSAVRSAAMAGWTIGAAKLLREILTTGDVSYEACVSLGSHGIALDVMVGNDSPAVLVTANTVVIGF